MTSPRHSDPTDAAPHDATFRCEVKGCRRRVVIPEAQHHSNATIALQVMAKGWMLHPQPVCPLHAATREAFSRPAPRRGYRPTRT